MHIGEFVVRNARRMPERPALGWQGERCTWRELNARVNRFAGVLERLGPGKVSYDYLIARFDRVWKVSTVASRTIKSPPSSYLKHIYFDAIVYDQETLDFLVEQVGVDRVLYGSDYPFNLGDMTGVLARVDALGPERADAIRSGNALALFDL